MIEKYSNFYVFKVLEGLTCEIQCDIIKSSEKRFFFKNSTIAVSGAQGVKLYKDCGRDQLEDQKPIGVVISGLN